MDRQSRRQFEDRARRVDALVERLEALPDGDAKRSGLDAIQALLELHGDVLARILDRLGPERAAEVAEDEAVGGLLLLHGIHPLSLEERVGKALEQVRPYMGSHGGGVRVLEVGESGVRLRLEGSCHNCPSSQATLKYAVEQALAEHAPDLARIEVEGVAEPAPAPAGFVSLDTIRRPEPRWIDVGDVDALPTDRVETREVGGVRLAMCRLGEERYAYQDSCPACGAGFGGASLEGEIVACPGCGARYDVRHAGRSPDDAGRHLEPAPLMSSAGGIRVALPAVRAEAV
ncbi:MAG TPA: NifU family protein [Candidatus Dormibacteraeota bacterium]|nr:NifU family protein [Candidatus Dormibacteraeota bacterium]